MRRAEEECVWAAAASDADLELLALDVLPAAAAPITTAQAASATAGMGTFEELPLKAPPSIT